MSENNSQSRTKEATSSEKVLIMNKYWSKAPDVQALTGCSRTRSYQILREIHKQILDEGLKPAGAGIVTMKRLIQYLGINPDEIFEAAKREKELENIK